MKIQVLDLLDRHGGTDHVLIVHLGRTSRQMAVERLERRHPERAERQREVSHLR